FLSSPIKPRIGENERQLSGGLQSWPGIRGWGVSLAVPRREAYNSEMATPFALWWWAGDVPLGRIQGVRSAPGGASRGQAGGCRTPAAGLRRAAQTRRAEAGLPDARPNPPAHRLGPRGLFADRRR